MAQVNMQLVKELRDRTAAGLNDCKAALVEAEGHLEKAVEVILKKGLAKSAKRAGAVASEGLVITRVSADGRIGVIAEVNIQTDFAARNDEFQAFADKVVDAALKAKAGADLGAEPFPGGSGTIEENRAALVGKLGENITVRRWDRLAIDGAGRVHSYVHMGGKIGVLLAVRTGSDAAAKAPSFEKFVDDSAMQIAAMAPLYLNVSEMPADARQKQAEIFDAQLIEEGKPDAARPKIIEGKLAKWSKEVCLLEQQSVLDADKTVEALRAGLAKELGTDVTLSRFVRFQLGEGIEKPTGPDFATEVAKMAGV
ncbi:MAG TPA: translation elongation factor Ts [Polyangiaceae bacterium]|jgi:elongation factor Ts|nr:translation elongation factor Ts [Polyangiaceae bacterium]